MSIQLFCFMQVRNPKIGYCQSMNFIAATFLLPLRLHTFLTCPGCYLIAFLCCRLRYCREEHAFWILCSVIEDLLPSDYYTEMLTGLRAAACQLMCFTRACLCTLSRGFEGKPKGNPAFCGVHQQQTPTWATVQQLMCWKGDDLNKSPCLQITDKQQAALIQSSAKDLRVFNWCLQQFLPQLGQSFARTPSKTLGSFSKWWTPTIYGTPIWRSANPSLPSFPVWRSGIDVAPILMNWFMCLFVWSSEDCCWQDIQGALRLKLRLGNCLGNFQLTTLLRCTFLDRFASAQGVIAKGPRTTP